MPEITHRGEFASQESRWPHGREYVCPECKSRFKLTVQDTEQNYYTAKTYQYEADDHRDSYTVNGYKIIFSCPVCGKRMDAIAPSDWYPDFPRMKPRA